MNVGDIASAVMDAERTGENDQNYGCSAPPAVWSGIMGSHKKQHWIPDTYLDAWCDPDRARQNPRRVHRYNPDGDYRDYRPPSRIFTVDDLYTVPGPDGERDLKTEHALNRLEDSFARLRRTHLVKGIPLTSTGRRDLIWFIAAMRNRSPAMHTKQQAFHDSVLRVANSMEDGLKAMSPEKRAEWHTTNRRTSLPRTDGDRGIPLSTYREIAARPFGAYLPNHVVIEAGLLERMHLMVIRTPISQSLITSDHPVVWWDPEDPPPSRSPLGLGRRTVEVTCPLTPHLCALISHRPGADYADTEIEGAAILNMRTLYRVADTFISCRPDLVVDWHEVPGSE
jgi:hypothetical protein